MQPLDHLFILVLLIGWPLYGAWSYRRFVARCRPGVEPGRVRLYGATILELWILAAVVAGLWLGYRRPAADLGMTPPAGAGFAISTALVALIAAVLSASWLAAGRADAETRLKYRESMGELRHFMPQSRREYWAFAAMSLTAGIVEEVVYRGYAIWFVSLVAPLWAAVLLSSILFGLAHSYQGTSGMAKTAGVGLGMALLYLLSGSIWLPMLAHAVIDLLQGATMLEIFRPEQSEVGATGGELPP